MTNLLEMQKDIAVEHVASSWPQLVQQAQSLPDYADIEQIVICGCGDSHHAGLGLSMGVSELAGSRCCATNAMTASRYVIPQFRELVGRLLVIGISASGEVARTLEALEVANRIGARTLALTGNGSSSLGSTADAQISFPGPSIPHGPGLISYLSSLMMGFALINHLVDAKLRASLETGFSRLGSNLSDWVQERWAAGSEFADDAQEGTCVFLGSGPAYGSALFGAAKLIEASGEFAWGQDVEEWAHLEYFCAPEKMRTWLLSASGRAVSRELEIRNAADAVGRLWHSDQWDTLLELSPKMNEILAPLVLWAGPTGYASRRAELRAELPFRGFEGGRDRGEGGGASRIRSSDRLHFD